jgi:CheY-like chemotaxis protein
MSKILLVEDDQSLREIYSIRLTAEGYEIVIASDGEEALALAVKEHPDLILSDVMMPKISGFDMLDILRSTPETKEMHVIMMTALSSEDQRKRGESLGADRYLVKSQVGIEDVVNAVHEVLGDTEASTPPEAAPAAAPIAENTAPLPTQSATPASPVPPVAPVAAMPIPEAAVAPSPVPPVPPVSPAPVMPAPSAQETVIAQPTVPAETPLAAAPQPEATLSAPQTAEVEPIPPTVTTPIVGK